MTNKNLLKILFIEDLPSDADLAVLELRKEGIRFEYMRVDTRNEFIKALNEFRPDIIISDYMMPSYNGMQALIDAREFVPFIPFILCTGSMNEETAVECLKAGANDYIIKEHLTRLPFAVKEALEQYRISKEKRAAELLLIESEEKLQSIFSAAPVGIGLVVNRIFMEVNDTFCKMTGYSRKELIGKSSELIYATREEYERDGTEKYRQISEKSTGTVETRFKCKNGKILNIQLNSSPLDIADLTKGVTFTAMDITERKKVQEELSESKQIIEDIINAIQVRVFWKDKNLVYLGCNKVFAMDSGFTDPKDIIGKDDYQMDWRDQVELYRKDDQQVIESGRSKLLIEEPQTTPEGKNITLLTSKIPLLNTKGEITGVIGTYIDITERHLAEQALRKNEEKYRNIFENVQDIYYEVSMDGIILEINPSISIISQGHYHREDLIGKSMSDIYSFPEERQLLMDELKAKGIINDFEITFKNHDGSLVPCSISSKICFNALGKPEKIIGSIRDISERKRAEEALQHNLAFSESLLKTIPFGMDIVDETGTLLFQSESFKRLFREEAIGKKCWEIYRDDKRQCNDCPLVYGITVGETEAFESHGVLGNRVFEINHTGMMYQGKKAMLEIFQDITDRKRFEVELINAKDKAEEGDRLKTAFLHNISHEIRTPMNAIVGFSALLGEPDVDTQSRKDYIEVIIQSSNHLLAIITDIVDIANIEANLAKIEKNDININSVLKSLCNQFLPKVNEKRIQLTCETDVPDSDAFIIADRTKLTQILLNLINNAIRFTDRGDVKVGFTLSDKFLEFHVSDTGIGISEEYHHKIFDRFYQIQHTESRLYEGIGLGLAISKANVVLMGGKIWLTSEPGKGTSFYFTIPYEKQVVETLAVNEKGVSEDFAFPEKKTILVAEDIDSNFKLVRVFLSNANTEIIRAANGKEAVEKCLSNKDIDLILMDIKMPVMDGYTAVKLIRETNSTIPIIAQTAYIYDKEQAIELGCSGFISKPFDKKGLLKVLHEFI